MNLDTVRMPWLARGTEKSNSGHSVATRITNVSRRDFLKTSSAIAGSAFLLGIWTGCAGADEPYIDPRVAASGEMGSAEFQPNLLVAINNAGDVFIVCSRSEMGQGIRTGMPVVIADELGADWNRVHIEQAVGDSKYGNQNTDGSTSVRLLFDDWRKAGATAREMLLAAAAESFGVPVSECVVDVHKVVHSSSGRELGFGDLASLAASQDVPSQPSFKDRKDWRYIGRSVNGYDNRDIGTGDAIYGADIRLDGMLFASVEHSPVTGGSIRSFSADAARQVPGVVDVLEIPTAPFPAGHNALGGIAVVAENTWASFKGREALEIDWDGGANSNYNSDPYHDLLVSSATNPGIEVRAEGDVSVAVADAETVVDATYSVSMLAHAPMEPPCAVAWVKNDGTCEIWAPTQAPQGARRTVAAALGVGEEAVTVHVTLLGGAFGRKSFSDFVAEAALVSRAAGAPILLTWKREDCMQFDYYHSPSVQYMQAGLDDAGKAISWLHRTAFPSIGASFGSADGYPSNGELGLGATTLPYDIPNICCEKCAAPNHVRIGWVRSVSNIHHAFAVNAFSGELAKAAGRDQRDYLLELIGPDRNLNHIYPGDTGYYGENLADQPYQSGRLRNVVERVTEAAGWGGQLPDGRALGLAAHYSFVAYVAFVIEASIENGSPRVHKAYCSIDCGTHVNTDRVIAQMEGATVFGLSLALFGEITATNGVIDQDNFDGYQLLRINEMPEIVVDIVPSTALPGGVGEPGLPPVAPALTNALLQLHDSPVRSLPIRLS